MGDVHLALKLKLWDQSPQATHMEHDIHFLNKLSHKYPDMQLPLTMDWSIHPHCCLTLMQLGTPNCMENAE